MLKTSAILIETCSRLELSDLLPMKKMLAANVEYLLRNPQEREKMQQAAFDTINQMRGALQKTNRALDSYLFPLTVKRDLEGLG